MKSFGQILKEANCDSTSIINKIDDFFYTNDRKTIRHTRGNLPFDPANFPIEEFIHKCYEWCCGDELLTLTNPSNEEDWLETVKTGLNANAQQSSGYNRRSYIDFVNYIINNGLLEKALQEVRNQQNPSK